MRNYAWLRSCVLIIENRSSRKKTILPLSVPPALFTIFIFAANRVFSAGRPVRSVRSASARCRAVCLDVCGCVYAVDRSCEMSGSCPRMQYQRAQSRPRALSTDFTASKPRPRYSPKFAITLAQLLESISRFVIVHPTVTESRSIESYHDRLVQETRR